MENKQEAKVLLKLLVDEKKDQVVAAEAKVDFMDILVSLLTLPMGTLIRLIKADAGVVGCMNNLYQSVENLSEKDLFIKHCKTMPAKSKKSLSKVLHEVESECRRFRIREIKEMHVEVGKNEIAICS
ncbi:hypothetical protein RND71_021415 [Anisodus tanguticus]|uniref:Uncharacterized protein n=1 Tax=Anisodus tanguticus TaxID=243964 RepID=A0AAE1VCR5_9SOLA|nr:hypothetical protein RND71_021415 [Anisodus tanguticus]